MTAPESIRSLQHFPTCTIIVGQSMMSATVTWLGVGALPVHGSHYLERAQLV